jgi:maltokinase
MANMTFADELAAWLPAQRWFAGKGVPVTGVAVASDTLLAAGDPALRHLIVTVSQGSATDDYQILAGERAELPRRLDHAVIGRTDAGLTAYDGLHDADLTRVLLAAMAERRTTGPLRFGREPGAGIHTGTGSIVLTGEQSNTSVLFGEEAILKVFRRPSPGPNPDLEVPRALARRGSPHVAPPLGWIESETGGTRSVLGILSTYLKAAADGWSLAATSVRDLYAMDSPDASAAGGDFAGEAHRLGEATAEVHRDLAAAFGTDELPRDALAELAAQMELRLEAALSVVPQLGQHASRIRATFAAVAGLDGPVTRQRIHGDYHLGQVMRTQTGWVLLDFEGEPAAPLAQRRARSLALRDVAGMLRSFDYAARSQLASRANSELAQAAARAWVRRNQAALCAGYAGAGGEDPVKHAVLLRAFLLDKAVYEVVYEARNRPSWLSIPLGSIAEMLAGDTWAGGQGTGSLAA